MANTFETTVNSIIELLEKSDFNYEEKCDALTVALGKVKHNNMHNADNTPVSPTKKPQNLMEGLLSEMNRCRDVLKLYEEIGPSRQFGAFHIKQSIAAAEKSISDNDVIQMLVTYEDLKTIE